MAWSFSGDKPIFMQLVDRINLDIISGKYSPGDRLPTVRDFSIEAGVNPNTVQRALSETENTGLIVTKRGDGRYVTTEQDIIRKVRIRTVEELTSRFVYSLRSYGLDDCEIETLVKKSINSERKESNNG